MFMREVRRRAVGPVLRRLRERDRVVGGVDLDQRELRRVEAQAALGVARRPSDRTSSRRRATCRSTTRFRPRPSSTAPGGLHGGIVVLRPRRPDAGAIRPASGRHRPCPRGDPGSIGTRRHANRHRRMVDLARCRVGVSRRRPSSRALRECARLRRDQFLVLPQPPRRGLPALGRADAARLSLFRQAAAHHQPRRAPASCTRAAAAIPGRSRRPGRPTGASCWCSCRRRSRSKRESARRFFDLARRAVRRRRRLRAAPCRAGSRRRRTRALVACRVGRVARRSGALSASGRTRADGSAPTATAAAPSSTTAGTVRRGCTGRATTSAGCARAPTR